MKKSNTFFGSVKTVVAFALLWMCTLSMMAENNKVYIEDFSIIPGETKAVSVQMDNETPIAFLQFDVTLPEGLSLDPKSIVKNPSRITRSSHSVSATSIFSADGLEHYRFTVLANTTLQYNGTIPGTEGELFTVDVIAETDYAGGSVFMDNVIGTDNTVVTNPVEVTMPDCTVKAMLCAGTLSMDVESVELVGDETSLVNVLLSNTIVTVGAQADLVLPEGVSLVVNEEGELFGYTDRLSNNVLIQHEGLTDGRNGYRIMISSLTNDEFEGKEGALFSFLIKGSQDIPEDAVIEIQNAVVSRENGDAFPVDCLNSIAVSYKQPFAKEDVNQDGVVDIDDMFAIIKLVNTAEYDEMMDVNGDGAVDIDDLFVVIAAIN